MEIADNRQIDSSGRKMNDEISVFKGVQSKPIDTTTWQDVLGRIQSDKYKPYVDKARSISVVDLDKYREYKKKMPAVTFCGKFNGSRKKANIEQATGFIIPDLDHLEDVEATFELLTKDENIWFAFRSPSGEGIKCGIRAKCIESDDDIKVLYNAVERYLKETYGITIDPACKDISRLTFVSYDPNLWINPDPYYFSVSAWAEPIKQQAPVYDPGIYHNDSGKQKYARKVLESCCENIRQSQPGSQHNTRLRMSRLIGGYIHYLDESEILSALEQAVRDSGAKYIGQAMKTVKDGLNHGKQNPLYIDDNTGDITYYCNIDEVLKNKQSNQSKQGKQIHINSSKVSTGKQESSKVSRSKQDLNTPEQTEPTETPINPENFDFGIDDATRARGHAHNRNKEKINNIENEDGGFSIEETASVSNTPQNLAAHIREWITQSSGTFTTDQIDREFCLRTRKEKNNRAKCLNAFIKENLIKRDKSIKGKYHILAVDLDLIDIEEEEEENFPIILPFDIHEYAGIPPKSIVVIAGESNAGKTAVILNILYLNLKQEYPVFYMMSEMGGAEFKSRLKGFGKDLTPWKRIKAASKSYDFDGVIQHYNRDGLTCIDYIEEISGEYFKIPSTIRDVYDALGNGVAVCAIQKKTKEDFARGGEGTIEKARLYLSVEYLTTWLHDQRKRVYCALRCKKVKRPLKDNINGCEMHFAIDYGCQVTKVMDWTRSNQVDRKKCIVQYEMDERGESFRTDDNEAVILKTDKDRHVRVIGSDIEKWQTRYQNIDVRAELEKLSESSMKKPFLKDKNWFFMVSKIIENRSKEVPF